MAYFDEQDWDSVSAPANRPNAPLAGPPRRPAPQTAPQARGDILNNVRTEGQIGLIPGQAEGQDLTNRKTERDLQVPAGMSDASIAVARDRINAARALQTQLDALEQAFAPYEGRTTVGEMTPFYHTEGLDRFRSTSEALMPNLRRLLRTPDASTTDRENAYYEAFIPSPSQRDSVNRDRINNLRNLLDQIEGQYAPQLPEEERARLEASRPRPTGARGVGAQIPGFARQAARERPTTVDFDPGFDPNAPLADSSGAAAPSNTQQSYRDEALYAAATRIRAMILRGDPDAAIMAEADAAFGEGAGAQFSREILADRRRKGLRRLRREGIPIAPEVYMRNRNLSEREEAGANLAYSDVGSGIGHFANAMTFNVVPEIMGGDARTRLEMSRAQNPEAAFVGDLVGSANPTRLAERSAAGIMRGLGANLTESSAMRYAPRVAGNATYGGVYGSAEAGPDNRLEGFAVGAGTSAAGGEIGAGTSRGVGTVVGGVRNPAARYLSDRGATMSPGQILRNGQGLVGRLGRIYSGMEQRATSFPVVGDAISDQYQQSYRTALNAGHDQALAPISGSAARGARTGEELMQATDAAVGQAYEQAFDGVQLRTDKPFDRLFSGAERLGVRPSVSEDQRRLLDPAFRQVRDLFQGGNVDGRRYQAAMQILRETRVAVRDTHLPGPAMSSLDRAEAAVRGLARRQRPQMIPALRAADSAYRRASVLRDATARAINHEQGIVSPGQFASAIRSQTRRYGGNAAASSTNRPFYELQDAMRQVLPERIPDSGSAGRFALPALIAGGSVISDQTPLTDNAAKYGIPLAMLYTNPGRAAMQTAMIRRPEFARRIGETLANARIQRYGSDIGRAAALPYIEDTYDNPYAPRY